MRVVHAVLSLDAGGLERVVVNLIRAGLQRGQQITVLCLERAGTFASEVESLGVPIVCVQKRAGLRFSIINDLRRIFREIKPDVVHTHQIGVLLYAGPAASAAGVKRVIHTEHGKQYRNYRRRWLGRLAAPWASRFICVSRDIAQEAIRLGIVSRRKVCTVANGIDPPARITSHQIRAIRASLGIPSDAIVIGTVGRLSTVKQHESLIRAFALIRRDVPTARLLLVGDGPRTHELHVLASSLNLSSDVHFAGYCTNPGDYLQAMDVFALTSRSEGMPLAILEAWATEVPVVSFRVGGVPELIDASTGVLVPPKDEWALANAIVALLDDPSRRAAIVREASQRFWSRYTLDRMADEYESHYRAKRESSRHRLAVTACASF
jgi:sugar transferase (PEP-CTERM/EpsH1 system associated)